MSARSVRKAAAVATTATVSFTSPTVNITHTRKTAFGATVAPVWL